MVSIVSSLGRAVGRVAARGGAVWHARGVAVWHATARLPYPPEPPSNSCRPQVAFRHVGPFSAQQLLCALVDADTPDEHEALVRATLLAP